MTPTYSPILKAAERHIRLRNLGYVLFCSGLLLFGYSLWHTSHTHIWINILLGFASVGTGLAVFGVNHDTAISLAVLAENEGLRNSFSPLLNRELIEDLEWDRSATLALQAHVKSSYFVIILSIAIQIFLVSRIF